MISSYSKEDVIILLKDISGKVEALDNEEREKRIQGGTHYSEMLPIEYKPSSEYSKLYNKAIELHSITTACAIGSVSEKILIKKDKNVVLVSLARAGIPIGILIKRYLKNKYNIEVPHYAISIIRGKGIDHNALKYILKMHDGKDIQFIDGWTGKGAILKELEKELDNYPGISQELAVAADPANITELCGTHEDFLIPSSCLNSTVSGLISRTFLSEELIDEGDFHGAVYYSELIGEDQSYEFIDEIEKHMDYNMKYSDDGINSDSNGLEETNNIAKEFGIQDINLIKPGIGETTRVLLRRVPWKVLVRDIKDTEHIQHILELAKEREVEVIEYPLINYRACGIIKDLAADI